MVTVRIYICRDCSNDFFTEDSLDTICTFCGSSNTYGIGKFEEDYDKEDDVHS